MSILSKELIFGHLESVEPFPVDFDNAWVWLGFSTKGNAKRNFENAGFIEDVDFEVFIPDDKNLKGGRPVEKIRLTIDCFKSWAMMASTTKGKEVRAWYVQVEKEWRQLKGLLPVSSIIPTSEIELAGHALDVAFAGVGLNPALLAGLKLNAIAAVHPQLRGYLDEGRKFIAATNAIESELLSPTAIGQKMGISARQVNARLVDAGLQEGNPNYGKYGHKREPRYIPTDRGREFCEITLATGWNTSASYQQIKWYESVIEAIV